MLKIGSKAPDFKLQDQEGNWHKLSDYKQTVLLYFYPKDDTPGCTAQACAIRDDFPAFTKLHCKVFGLSADSIKKHEKFAEKFNLPFTLLSDEKKTTLKKYGVWQLKKFMGREYMGIMRTSFLIDAKGKIIKIYEKVKPETHAEEVIEDLKEGK